MVCCLASDLSWFSCRLEAGSRQAFQWLSQALAPSGVLGDCWDFLCECGGGGGVGGWYSVLLGCSPSCSSALRSENLSIFRHRPLAELVKNILGGGCLGWGCTCLGACLYDCLCWHTHCRCCIYQSSFVSKESRHSDNNKKQLCVEMYKALLEDSQNRWTLNRQGVGNSWTFTEDC